MLNVDQEPGNDLFIGVRLGVGVLGKVLGIRLRVNEWKFKQFVVLYVSYSMYIITLRSLFWGWAVNEFPFPTTEQIQIQVADMPYKTKFFQIPSIPFSIC
jgi:hypothetical protein